MGCWKWFDGVLKEANVKVTAANRAKVDQVIHEFIGKSSKYGSCSSDWRSARKTIQTDAEAKKTLIQNLQAAAK